MKRKKLLIGLVGLCVGAFVGMGVGCGGDEKKNDSSSISQSEISSLSSDSESSVSLNESVSGNNSTQNGESVENSTQSGNSSSEDGSSEAENNSVEDSSSEAESSSEECIHNWGSEITTKATCTDKGVQMNTCSLCGDSYTEEIVALGHTYENGKCTACEKLKPSDGLGYLMLGDGTYCVASMGICTDTDIVIPDEVNGIPVTGIANNAFWSDDFNVSITSVVIPDSIVRIGAGAFGECYDLTSVEIGDGVKSIGDYAFCACRSLASIEIPNSVTNIGAHVFRSCDSLTSVVIPDSVTSIGDDVFGWCSSLTSVVISDGVTSIGDKVFYYCESLTSVVIPHSVTSIGADVFERCNNLTTVYYKGTAEDWSKISINSSGNTPLTNATHYYYSEKAPTSDGNYWHYDENGEIVVWA